MKEKRITKAEMIDEFLIGQSFQKVVADFETHKDTLPEIRIELETYALIFTDTDNGIKFEIVELGSEE